jgi:hypothetical protein
MANYREAIAYLADFDDVDSSKEFPSVCVSMVASLFKKTTDQVIDDVEREKNGDCGTDDVARAFCSAMKKLGFTKNRPKTQQIINIDWSNNGWLMNAVLRKEKKYNFSVYFFYDGHIRHVEGNWEIDMEFIDLKAMIAMIFQGLNVVQNHVPA